MIIKLKTHLITTDIHEEYHIDWSGRLIDTKPKLVDGKPLFILIGSESRSEVSTTDMRLLERYAKLMTRPKGRQSLTSDTVRIYIKEESGKLTLMGTLTHNHIRQYAPVYDKFEK